MNPLVLRPHWSQALLRPLPRFPSASSLPSTSAPTSHTLQLRPPPRRHAATSRRMTKALRVKPASSASAAIAAAQRLAPRQNSIVFNPPPTAPSPYETPPLFLPASDPRRTLLAPVHAHNNPYRRTAAAAADGEDTNTDLPPAFRPPGEKKYHLGAEQIEEIRSKRTSNPWVWTRKRLAEEYGCSEYFVSLCAQAIPERRKWHEQNLEAMKARWGPKRQKAREERAKRHKIWQRDE